MRDKILWDLFYLNCVVGVIFAVLRFMGVGGLYRFILPIVSIYLHAFYSLGKRGVFFLVLSAVIGFIFEFAGVSEGFLFGQYYYTSYLGPTLFGVPFLVILFWPAFIYTGYAISNSFLLWQNKKIVTPLHVLGIVLLDVIIVVASDLFIDPLFGNGKAWVWLSPGPFFGIPLSNFLGWAVVVFLASAIFRTIEFRYPFKHRCRSAQIIPILAYSIACLSFFSYAIFIGQHLLAVTGFLAMMPIFILNLHFYMQ